MKIMKAMLALGLVAVPAASQAAGLYLGAAGAYVEHPSYSDVDAAFGGKVFLGYRFSPAPIFLEASYLDAGQADISSTDGLSIGFKGYTLGAGYFAALSPLGSGAWLRASYYSGKSRLEDKFGTYVAGGSFEETSNGAAVGIGAQWKPVEWFGVRAEYESLIGAKDFSDDKGLGLLSLGVVFEFGQEPGAHRAVLSPAAPAAASPVVFNAPVPAPTPAAAPPLAQPSVAAMAPPMIPASAAASVPQKLLRDAPMKVQPRAGTYTQATLSAGSVVQVQRQISNDEGAWCFVVDAGGHTGWVAAQAFLP